MTNSASAADFASLPLRNELIETLKSLDYRVMTPVQAKSLPPLLSGKDVIAQAKTGSGKTAAFGLALLQRLQEKRFCVQALVLCPTRELADQVSKELRRLARGIHNIKVLTLCGGMPFGPQVGSLEHGAHIVVGTPGRLEDHIRRGTLKLNHVTTLVLDEADRMLEMGFQETLDKILEQVPKKRQTLLFSATYPDEIRDIANRVMQHPIVIKVEGQHGATTIEQQFFKVARNEERPNAVLRLLLQHQPESALVFCNTRHETKALADELRNAGFAALALHGEMEQRDRDQTLVRFANRSASVLVATDVAARGLDIESLDMVLNYHLARDAEVHTHRIGRTGRAGEKGLACSLTSDKESRKVERLEAELGRPLPMFNLPADSVLKRAPLQPNFVTLQIDGGKKQKLRKGDILGGLTGKGGIDGAAVGKIDIYENWAYVAVHRTLCKAAMSKLANDKLKGRSFRVRIIPV